MIPGGPSVPLFLGRSSRPLLAALCLLFALPSSAQSLADRLDFSMYGRVGVGWAPTSGEFIQGKTFNLTGRSVGGRLEEGDYLEPSLKLHLLKPAEGSVDAPYAYAVLTPAMWANNGLFIGLTSNRFSSTLALELGEAYVAAGNILVPGLKFWGGVRFYRGTNVYLADYWYFNNLSAQGLGVQYGPIDVAVLLQTSATLAEYAVDTDGDGEPDRRRQRTVIVGQYTHTFQSKHAIHLLTEIHALPEAASLAPADARILPPDVGVVGGVKGHVELGNGSFNDTSVRIGSRIANGSLAGLPTWNTYGLPAANGRYSGAYGVEVVNHLLYNVNPLLSVNAYGTLHAGRGASGAVTDRYVEYALGAQSTLYLHDQFHLVNEASFQGFREGHQRYGTALKLSLVPTLVPTGKRDVWARPHLRLFYTLAVYNQASVDRLISPYLQTVGGSTVGHYLGARVEWWL
ncbi:carbohydrate porin [Myxococcus sp. CA051A]|nr:MULTISPECIES: carbohydrate porin [Myxococcus]NTX03103.1 carbohydrate porin [Myxococcus sp. CA040A]NTX11521.1 carbohydrate porin [Myxococcus sp. CA056]NTX60792.1 carbohydrate porin [Myxococcus sp. CA051A]